MFWNADGTIEAARVESMPERGDGLCRAGPVAGVAGFRAWRR